MWGYAFRTALCALALCGAVPAAAAARCTVHGFAYGGGPDPLPVWSEPNDMSATVGELPQPDWRDEMEGRMSAEFDVVEARGGWFRIENGRPWNGGTGNAPPPVSGWISGRHVRFALQTEMGFGRADPRSEVRYRSRERLEPHMLAAVDCDGEWVRLIFSEGGEVRDGWFRGVCAIQETTCDSLVGDRIPD